MNIFELIFTQPVFNLLLFLYEVIPGEGLGIAIILFTVIIRFAMWPMVKKQLHHGRVMRQLQPQLAEIKKKAKGDKQLQGRLTMELYKEKGINPLSSIGLIAVQAPFFIALYSAVRIMTQHHGQIPEFTYGFMRAVPGVSELVAHPEQLQATLLGIVDLTESAFSAGGWASLLLFAIVIATAVLMFLSSKQMMPESKDRRRLRDMLKDQAAGKEVDQSEVMQAATQRTMYIFPVVILVVASSIASALALYIFASVASAYVQQKIILLGDEEEMEGLADKQTRKPPKPAAKTTTKSGAHTKAARAGQAGSKARSAAGPAGTSRAGKAQPAEIIKQKGSKKTKKKTGKGKGGRHHG